MTNPLSNPPYDNANPVQTPFNLLLNIKGNNDLEIAIHYYILRFLLSQPGTLDGVKTVHFARFQFWSPATLTLNKALTEVWNMVSPAIREILEATGKGNLADAILTAYKTELDKENSANSGGLPFQKQVSLITTFDGDFSRYIVDFSEIIYPRFNLLLPFADIPDNIVPVQKNIGNFLQLMRDNQNTPVSFSSNYGALTLVQILQNAKKSEELAKAANN